MKVGLKPVPKTFNFIQDSPFRGCLRMGGSQKGLPPQNLLQMFYYVETRKNYTLPKKDPKKNMNHVTHCWSSADISNFS